MIPFEKGTDGSSYNLCSRFDGDSQPMTFEFHPTFIRSFCGLLVFLYNNDPFSIFF